MYVYTHQIPYKIYLYIQFIYIVQSYSLFAHIEIRPRLSVILFSRKKQWYNVLYERHNEFPWWQNISKHAYISLFTASPYTLINNVHRFFGEP